MKRLLLIFALFILGFQASVKAGLSAPLADSCNAVVINDTEEQNGIFIIGNSGQKAAIDIPIASDIRMTITGVKVTLSSVNPPTFVNLRFYNDTLSTPEDPSELPQEIPGDIMFTITDCEIDTFEIVGYEPMHQFYVRNITLALSEPIVLDGSQVGGRFWMVVLSDANAWATTAHYDTGEGVIGEAVAMGSNNSQWFQMINLEGLYELEAVCTSTVPVRNLPYNQQISIYPNPAADYISINNRGDNDIVKIELLNLSGQILKQYDGNLNYISLSGINDGMYLLRLTDDSNNVSNQRIVKSSR